MSKPKQVIPEKCIGFPMEATKSTITSRDAMIYALGIGYSSDATDTKHLNFTYENSEDFKVCPTLGNLNLLI